MRNKYYSIAGHCIEISSENMADLVLLKDFEEKNAVCRPAVRVRLENKIEAVSSCYGISYCRMDSGYRGIFISEKNPGVRMITDDTYENAVIEGSGRGFLESMMELLLVDIYSYLSAKEWLLIHAACIEHEGSGLIFTGRSGIGKTTQAKLWNEYTGAKIMNGDKVLLEPDALEGVLAWGSPWKGSSPYACNRCVPLKAIIALEQGDKNCIRELRGMEKLEYITTNIFYPFWDRECMEKSMNTMERLGALPIYLLSCRPEEEAVKMTLEHVFRKR